MRRIGVVKNSLGILIYPYVRFKLPRQFLPNHSLKTIVSKSGAGFQKKCSKNKGLERSVDNLSEAKTALA